MHYPADVVAGSVAGIALAQLAVAAVDGGRDPRAGENLDRAAIHASEKETHVKRIIVGVGRSADADVLRWSADLARRTGLEIVAARVFTPMQAELSAEIATELHARQRRELEKWCEPVIDVDSLTAVLLDGDPSTAATTRSNTCSAAHPTETSSAKWSACSFSALKSLQTAHSPVTFAVAPFGSATVLTWSMR